MMRLFDKIRMLSADGGFLRFQHDLAKCIYDALGQGYAASDNEVSLVKRAVGAVNGQSYRGIRLFATIIHGSRSYVEFNFMDKPVTKELGDMTVITLVTDKADRLFQKVCIVQNKKEHDASWGIDPEQLFLLKNFPPFTGKKGIFKRCKDIIFRNVSGALGCYGLFLSPGEMIFASAPVVAEVISGKKSLAHTDLCFPAVGGCGNLSANAATCWPVFPWRHLKEFVMIFEEFLNHYGYPFLAGAPFNRFLGCTQFARDIHDFSRNWTQINIGEPTAVLNHVVNPEVDAFANFVIRSAGFEDFDAKLSVGDYFGDQDFDGQMAVLLMHMDISRKE